ncbi:pseudouridine-5'-phosphate glycosidase [Brevibacillus laterosporus]|uniref:pseudouridine-5'-phosphate glycosidase n=1 Tax=Brevibacillus laterosporus TaxID=1465 RepID=UPI000E6B6EDE|nr:pseudouridine-5'-phosphate glycosidase [Brevibacillus laterosporus]AYB41177.1 pseudouridine-5'-phosphate glycosidase [Brevibacillus laterosporus]MBM7110040.1 Pseudouridine-5'-phosphate glycosidase [Brevibacillus laterosporus]NKQ20985.1 pseudouridine-5'-phosphate glycosidase [Brevibacillus laterosporus]WNX30656.1 pseudouridine-5'-phosphate glycosidase [Brevibacillus laterosporus]
MKNYLTFTEEVAHALENKLPIVALETTIISHGMPYPQNIEMAKKVEQIIRDNGAVPATIGIMDGKIKIGLTDQELQEFATNKSVEKVSRRDFPYILATGKIGATTVAGTMIAAELAGIEMFATGGIGGVHREGEVTWDVSADLTELANTSVAVVCAGCKSILDIGRTLEYLETQGVPVVGYKTDEFPSFYSRKSGYGVDFKLDTPDSVASVMDTKWKLGMQGGMVVSNPVPEESALPYDQIEAAIQQALAEAKENNIAGKKVTPFLLSKVKELTAGKSLETNIALVYHNAEVAAKIAVEYKKKQHQ